MPLRSFSLWKFTTSTLCIHNYNSRLIEMKKDKRDMNITAGTPFCTHKSSHSSLPCCLLQAWCDTALLWPKEEVGQHTHHYFTPISFPAKSWAHYLFNNPFNTLNISTLLLYIWLWTNVVYKIGLWTSTCISVQLINNKK